jgi:hypothetical protein
MVFVVPREDGLNVRPHKEDIYQAKFTFGMSGEHDMDENAREKFGPDYGDPIDRKELLKKGLIDKNGEITSAGWDIIGEVIDRLEDNILGWLKKKFVKVSDVYSVDNELNASVEFDAGDPDQVEHILLGINERIDLTDSSYGDLAGVAWRGISHPLSYVIDGWGNFELRDPGLAEKLETRLEWERTTRKSR